MAIFFGCVLFFLRIDVFGWVAFGVFLQLLLAFVAFAFHILSITSNPRQVFLAFAAFRRLCWVLVAFLALHHSARAAFVIRAVSHISVSICVLVGGGGGSFPGIFTGWP